MGLQKLFSSIYVVDYHLQVNTLLFVQLFVTLKLKCIVAHSSFIDCLMHRQTKYSKIKYS